MAEEARRTFRDWVAGAAIVVGGAGYVRRWAEVRGRAGRERWGSGRAGSVSSEEERRCC